MPSLDRLTDVIDELSTWSFSTVLSIPDPTAAGGLRAPTLAEISAAELSVFLVDALTYITAWIYGTGTWAQGTEQLKNVDVKNTGRGTYAESTGTFTILLHAGDNPCVASGTAIGLKERHEALLTIRYNGNIDQFHKRVQFQVLNVGKVPREA